MRLPSRLASRTSRSVERIAASASRTSGWLVQSPVRASGRRSARRYSSSEWKAARRLMWRRTASTPSSSGTSSVPVEAPMNTLIPQQPGRRSSSPSQRGVLVRAADVEGVVAVHAALGPGELVGQRVRVGGGGLGVGHLEHGDDAAQHRAARAALQVLLPLQAGLAEVDLGVDHARHDGQARGVEHLAGARPGRGRRRAAILPPRTPMSARPRPAWFTTSPPRTIRS